MLLEFIRKIFSLYTLWIGIVGAEMAASFMFLVSDYASLLEWIYLSFLATFAVWWWFGDYRSIKSRPFVRVFIVSTVSAIWVLSHIPNPQYPMIVPKMYHDASVQVLNPSYESYDQFLLENSEGYVVEANGVSSPDTSYQTWKSENPLYVAKNIPYQEVNDATATWHQWFYHYGIIEGLATGVLVTFLWWLVRSKTRISKVLVNFHTVFRFMSPLIPLGMFTVAYISWNTFATIALYNS